MQQNAVVEKDAEISLLGDVYRNANMGAEAVLTLLPKVEDKELVSELTSELSRYEELAAEARMRLGELGEQPKEEKAFSKLMAKMGINMNTMIDKTGSHIAEMVMEGAVMGITDVQKRLNDGREYGESGKIANKLLEFEQDTMDRMRRFL